MDKEENSNIIKERSKQYGTQLWDLIRTQVDKHSSVPETISEQSIPPKKVSEHRWLMNLLFIVPYILLAVFGVSFFWDFNGMSATLFDLSFSFEGLLRIISISGLIGFLTNWLAITMLFRPTHRRPILGQGLIPAQKDRIAYRLASAVSEDLINPEIIKHKIQESGAIAKYREKATVYVKNIIDDPEFRENLKALVVSYVDEMIADPEVRSSIAQKLIRQIDDAIDENSFEKVALKAYSFLKGQEMQDLVESALIKLPTGIENGLNKMDVFLDELPDKLDEHGAVIEELVTNLLYKLINQLDVHALVEDNLRQYDEKKLEKLIKNASNDQLQYIQYLGAVLGTFGGFIIWEPVASLVVLTVIIGSTVAADIVLHRMKQNI
ncbi:MAG: DUF445 domain-containing protein [Balneola sp.]|jgi:uncharacterized membrane protein YheB (UPF0754 family)|nr:DUF445 domain-containing protein [Balneola sp.]MBE79379.1 DUF445 domain-containing protein [Balneola sp.]HBX67671.1 DUF445 domain-containing protein [Balneolaceae bacterium]|tara:strand:+ start:256 stop:1395 length:1140 start_codon:yes stop_codon:yes gene_type:complete